MAEVKVLWYLKCRRWGTVAHGYLMQLYFDIWSVGDGGQYLKTRSMQNCTRTGLHMGEIAPPALTNCYQECQPIACSFSCFFLHVDTVRHACIHGWGVPGHPLHPYYSPIWSVTFMYRSRSCFLTPTNLAKIKWISYERDYCTSVCVFS